MFREHMQIHHFQSHLPLHRDQHLPLSQRHHPLQLRSQQRMAAKVRLRI